MIQFWNNFSAHLVKLWNDIQGNVVFLLQFLAVIVSIFVLAYIAEQLIRKKNQETGKILTTRKIAVVGVMAAISGILMIFEVPIPFIAPDFYKLDLSELPVLITGFAFGPVAGVLAEAVKILVKLMIKGTGSAFVGELANFAVGSVFILTATIVYDFKKTKKMAVLACIAGTLLMTLFGTVFNAVYLLPKFAQMYGMDLSALVAIGTDVNSHINSVTTFVIICVGPLNLIKGAMVSIVTILIYQPLRPLFKKNGQLTR